VSEAASERVGRGWRRRLVARNPGEADRVSTPLELFFDLCFVVAVSQASAELHHAVSANHSAQGVLNYLLVFFAIWWAWMNFSWFASAYDNDDALYRLTTLVQIAGGLVLAAGVSRAAQTHDFTFITVGYVIMRFAMVGQWLRAAHDDPPRRKAALRFAGGIALVQVGWVCRLALPEVWFLPGFLILAGCELLVPAFAERAAPTTWHPHHIAERYGLFTLIVLGESVLSTSAAIQAGFDAQHAADVPISLAIAALVIVFSMWWVYFGTPGHARLTSLKNSMVWGYGQFFIFASAAAVGAGLAVAVDYDMHQSQLRRMTAGLAVTLPVSVYLLGVWLLQYNPREPQPGTRGLPVVALLILGATLGPAPVSLTALLLALLVMTMGRGSAPRATS
jgi:low temperature requirement protein LtrA